MQVTEQNKVSFSEVSRVVSHVFASLLVFPIEIKNPLQSISKFDLFFFFPPLNGTWISKS